MSIVKHPHEGIVGLAVVVSFSTDPKGGALAVQLLHVMQARRGDPSVRPQKVSTASLSMSRSSCRGDPSVRPQKVSTASLSMSATVPFPARPPPPKPPPPQPSPPHPPPQPAPQICMIRAGARATCTAIHLLDTATPGARLLALAACHCPCPCPCPRL